MTRLKAMLLSVPLALAMIIGVGAFAPIAAQAAVCASPCYLYAGVRQTATFDTISLSMSKENPTLDAKAYHALSELAVTSTTGNDVIEVGITKDPTVCAAGVSVCLFMFNWVNGVPGCYNGCGAVNGVGCAPYCLGASLDGIANGTTKTIELSHISGYWWAAFDGAWRFAMPDTDWGTRAFSTAANYQIFGEVADQDDTSCANMANGVLPTGTPTFLGGKFNSITMQNAGTAVTLSPTAFATSPTKYNALMVTSLSARYGGPGPC
jgi:hypothetical protein